MLYEKNVFACFLVGKIRSNEDVGAARGSVFQELRPGAGFKTGDFIKERLGGLPYNDSGMKSAWGRDAKQERLKFKKNELSPHVQ